MMEIYTTATFDELFVKLPKKIQNRADEIQRRQLQKNLGIGLPQSLKQ